MAMVTVLFMVGLEKARQDAVREGGSRSVKSLRGVEYAR